MGEPRTPEVTRLLREVAERRDGAAEELFERVYGELRAMAAARMRGEQAGHTLQATALVHEAWLRLAGEGELETFETRGHFYTAAAEAMRRILIDHARARGSQKRGGQAGRLPLDVLDLAQSCDLEQTLALDDAISRLEQLDSEAGQVVRLRFYAGLEVDETARALGLSPRTAARDWAFARAWLFQELGGAR